MTPNYSDIKSRLLDILEKLASLFDMPRSLPGMDANSFREWQTVCDTIGNQLSQELIRVAVVGSIKSGKSTFINSLLAGDYLKRGAGVVTSIVTRVRHGSALKATLFFKSWDQVNRDIDDALVLLPDLHLDDGNDRFDIRRKADRQALAEALGSLGADQLITHDTRNANGVVLSSYLQGYERVKDTIGSEPETVVYDGKRFDAHRAFSGDDALAVYLTDIEIEINAPNVGEQIEIADCQGSDSSNPLHLAMIQDYLNVTHLIIYVISSRTGLRRADIRFLSMIKKMGISDNIMFVINFDFNEHAAVDEFGALVEKTVAELAMIKPAPQVFTLSALFKLFQAHPDALPDKDRRRYDQWKTETDFSALSSDNYHAFHDAFQTKMTSERYAVLLRNHLERIDLITAGMVHWQDINRKMVATGAEISSQIAQRIEQYQARVDHIRVMMHSTLDGAVIRIRKEIKADIDSFFGYRGGGLIGTVINFIKSHDVSPNNYLEDLSTQGFNSTMYQVFQDFRQAIDTFMAQNINPRILGYVREKEKEFGQHLESVAGPYDVMIQDAIAEFSRSLADIGIPPMGATGNRLVLPGMAAIKRTAGVQFPPAVMTMQYSAKIKTEAVLRLGFYTVLTLLKRVFKKPMQSEREKEINALSDSIRRMRREMQESVVSHFIDYKENIKFQYIIKLVDAVSNTVKETLLNRFQSYVDSLLQMMSLIDTKQLDEAHASEVLDEMEGRTTEIQADLQQIRATTGLRSADPDQGG